MRLKILSLIFTLLSFLLLTNLNDSYKTRYLDQLKTLFSVNGYKNYLMSRNMELIEMLHLKFLKKINTLVWELKILEMKLKKRNLK